MDPITQTAFTVMLMAAATWFAKRAGRQEGINAAVSYLLEMGAVTENDLKKANERFQDAIDDEDDFL